MERPRQRRGHRACDPCRRKKIKCPGERPVCSYCRRLGQACDYQPTEQDVAQITHNRVVDRRIEAIEGKLDQLLQSLNHSQFKSGSHSTPHISPPTSEVLPEPMEGESFQPAESIQNHTSPESVRSEREPDIWLETGIRYQTWCHNQPLSLFRPENFLTSLESRDPELRLSIQALSSRFPPGTPEHEDKSAMVQECRKIIMLNIASSNVKLSTLQTLCILSLLCFAEGNVMQAGLDIGMAQYFATSLPSDSFLDDPTEHQLCVQNISLLRSMQACISDIPADNMFTSTNRLTGSSRSSNRNLSSSVLDSDFDNGLMRHLALAAETWHMARAYAAYQVGPDEPPPWDPSSDYSLIMLRHMELDVQFPLKYRYARNKFGAVPPDALHEGRDYWAPWLLYQFLYAGIASLVNHPFLLSMRLRNFRHMMPQTFLHQSYDQITRSSAWIIHFLNLIEKQRFQVSDPSITHCVAIVATIHLQHSFVPDDILRAKAQNGYDTCLRFLDRMAKIWPCAAAMALNLRNLQESIAMEPFVADQSNQAGGLHCSWSINADLLWNILIYERAGRHNAAADRTMFGNGVTSKASHHEDDIAEFAMVGSAGMSGHKTVAVEVTAYAPDDDEEECYGVDQTTSAETMESGWDMDDRLRESLGDADAMDQNHLFLQVSDFGKAIDNWFSVDAN
ncbi:hypothetical protein F53441_10472 [Fusarium austroafricanum]|uniref:Zn(2)-C6 fungal-type domain-containing protein n=1 Tax=Fusarium austroafricanum TaxID=2364996 RepID=A0A8H4K8P6_9HYPO|nr:hypothetical protein F53441_10472 [Fusarium austroafricanum]